MQVPYSKDTGLPYQTSETPETLPGGDLATLISLQQGFHANLLVFQDKEKDLMMNVTYGLNSLGLSAKYDQASASWKMCQDSYQLMMDGSLEKFSMIWPRSGIMLCGIAYQLPPLARITREIESGLWPTPLAQEGGQGINPKSRGKKLHIEVKKWPTPTAHLAKETNAPSEAKRNEPSLSSIVGGKLNPQFVEWLMGYPTDHTALNASETQSFQQLRKSSSKK